MELAAAGPTIRLVTHSEVVVAADRAAIWPLVLQPDGWKQGLHPVHESGERDAVGEIRAARGEHDGQPYALVVETVALQALTRKVVRITTGPGEAPSWAAWHLVDAPGGGVLVTYDVYGEVPLGPGVTAEQAAAAAPAYVAEQQARFDAELQTLAALVLAGGG